MKRLFLTILFACISIIVHAQNISPKSVFSIKAIFDSKQVPDSAAIDLIPYDVPSSFSRQTISKKVKHEMVQFLVSEKRPIVVSLRFLPRTSRVRFLAEARDSIIAKYTNGGIIYSGRGSEKIRLQEGLKSVKDSMELRLKNKVRYETISLEDYLEWNLYLNERTRVSLLLIDSYRPVLSNLAYQDIRNNTLDAIADSRSDKFSSFTVFAKKNGYSNSDISKVYDSTYVVNSTVKELPSLSGSFFGSWGFVRKSVYRRYNFDSNAFPLNSETASTMLFYKAGCAVYSGIALEKFKSDFLTKQVIHDLGFVPETDSLLKAYYKEPGDNIYKKFVREYEFKARSLKVGQSAPGFALTATNGMQVVKANFKGKVVLMDFWFTGCVGCIQMTPVLRRIEEYFKGDSNIVFLSVSIDKSKEQWLRSIKEGEYTTGTAINLYTGGSGNSHPIIKDFQVVGYPSLYLIDAGGKVVVNPVPDPRGSKESELIELIKRQLVLLKDGPYVFNEAQGPIAYSLNGSKLSTTKTVNNTLSFKVATDQYRHDFDIRLQTSNAPTASGFPTAEKLLALSDIEGNFDAFRKLLQSNGVIDNQMNWTFGKGNLVFAGDMFDRGQQVTECLWLIYSLEEKAAVAGGGVHFILGNHELMNLSGDVRYVKEKYIENAKLIGKSYVELYRENSEIGRWLRTKNIVEKIGPLLFTHGGVSPEFINLGLTLDKVNELARPYYDNDSTARKSDDKNLATMFSTKKGPFWYRDYYLDAPRKIYSNGDTVYKTSQATVDKTLAFYGVKHIVTGHSIVDPGEHVTVHYNNKVINTDTKHAKGKSEALLVEGNSFYRVNDKGQRWLLFKDEDDAKSSKQNNN